MPEELRCVLIDDELLALSYLRTLFGEIPDVTVVKAYDDPEKLLDEIGSLKVDFCVSDIVMPSMSGLSMVEKLNNLPVIFTTAHNEFAADAFDVQAVDYLRKPVRKERLLQALDKMRKVLERKPSEPVSFNTAKGKLFVEPEGIAFIAADTPDRRDKLLVLKSGEEVLLKNYSFEQLTAMLPPALFIRLSRKDLVAKSIIKGHSSGKVFSNFGNREFTLGENYRRSFLDQFPADRG